MAKTPNTEEVGDLKTFQAVSLIFSILFLFVVGNGYYNLFLTKIGSTALVVALLLAALAWLLAKLIGTNKGKILGNLPLFFLLLIISSVGVFNAMMLNLEGKIIYLEAIEDAGKKFGNLFGASDAVLSNYDKEIEAKIRTVNGLHQLLDKEIENPLNCGQGPRAIQIGQDLKKELPLFQMLSIPVLTKSRNQQSCESVKILASYNSLINELLYNHPDLVKVHYKENKEFKSKIEAEVKGAQEELKELSVYVNNGGGLLKDNNIDGVLVKSARGKLEDISTNYANLAVELKNYAPKAELQMNLNITDVRSLGEWSQLVNLILDRLDKPSTYVYFGLSVFFDWILIYLFTRLSSLKAIVVQQKIKPIISESGITSSWQNH
jgi:hypothetical protein